MSHRLGHIIDFDAFRRQREPGRVHELEWESPLFIDWLTIRQVYPHGGLPVFAGGYLTSWDADGVEEYQLVKRGQIEGSFDDRMHLRCDGNSVEFHGNIARWERPDNGTPGQPATPDAKFDVQDPTLIGSPGGSRVGLHYYKPSTVKGDSNNPGGSGDGDGKCEEGEKGSADCTDPETGGDCEEGEECGEDSASGDGCEEEPQCKGEPIECYLVIKQWETMCALAVPANEKIDAAIEAAAGEGGMEEGSLIPEYDPDGGPAGVNVLEKLQEVLNGNGGGASCIADLPLNLTIGGRTANSAVPLSSMCDLFKIVGLFVMLSAGLRSAWIIMRGYGSN